MICYLSSNPATRLSGTRIIRIVNIERFKNTTSASKISYTGQQILETQPK
jgi:hypothetical protein